MLEGRATHWLAPLAFLTLATAACQSPSSATQAVSTREPVVAAPASGGAAGQAPASALLELFTSEGCSSCPAADAVLARLTEDAARTGQRVFTLELHVDYWNYLGWVDPFSDALSTARQGAYAKRRGLRDVYTPQLWVNGREELVGSDRSGARAAIDRALGEPARAAVAISAQQRAGNIEVDYRVDAPRAVELNVAVADDTAQTQVSRGENANQRLLHRHVVRGFRSVSLAGRGSGSISLPWHDARGSAPVYVVAFASDPATLEVLGADARLLAAGHVD